MILTHIIGNGFDINQGLKTSYPDFYNNYYLKQKSSNEIIEDLKKNITEKNKDWSDLELRLGEYTENISSLEELDIIMEDLQGKLADYISKIESKEYSIDIKVADEFKQDFIEPFRHLKLIEIEKFNKLINTFGPVTDVNVLSFNYTSTHEKILQMDNSRIIGSNGNIKVKYGGTTYIHNSIGNKRNIVLGVDNPSQIKNESFKKDNLAHLLLVKPQIIASAGNLNDRRAIEIIQQSNIISLFGVSLGDTDTTWWKEIGNSINSNRNKKLIYYDYYTSQISNIYRQLVAEQNTKTRIINKMGIINQEQVFVNLHDGKTMFKKALFELPF